MWSSTKNVETIVYVTSLVSAVGLIVAFSWQLWSFHSSRRYDDFAVRRLGQKVTELEHELVRMRDESRAANDLKPESTDVLSLKAQIRGAEKRIVDMEKVTEGVREAIGAGDADRIISLARLRDRMDSIEKNSDQLYASILKGQGDVEASSRQIQLTALIVIAPLVVNILLHFWRDRGTKKAVWPRIPGNTSLIRRKKYSSSRNP